MRYEDFEAMEESRGIASGLRGLQTFEDVAALLGVSMEEIEDLAFNIEAHYEIYREPKASGGFRTIEKPSLRLRSVQRRLKQKLGLEPLPIYQGTPAQGRSNITNAMAHRDRRNVACIDIKDHFRSCRRGDVVNLFRWVIQCSEDAALLLAHLTCLRGHLPTGAPTSPLLAYLSYAWMFHELYAAAGDNLCRLSVFADDLTISWRFESGDPTDLLENFKCVLQHYGFSINDRKTRKYNQNQPAEVTGVILMPDGELRMPNRMHRKLFEWREVYRRVQGEERQRIRERIKGLEQYKRQIERVNRRPIRRLEGCHERN